MSNQNNFEKKLQSKAFDFELQPAPASWDAIAAQLDKNNKKRFLIWIVSVGVCLILSGVIYLSLPVTETNTTIESNISYTANPAAAHEYSSRPNVTLPKAIVKDKYTIINGNSTAKSNIKKNSFYSAISNTNQINYDNTNIQKTVLIKEDFSNETLIKINSLDASLTKESSLNPLTQDLIFAATTNKFSNWSIGFFYQLMQTNSNINYTPTGTIRNLIDAQQVRKSDPALQQNFGLQVYFRLNKKFHLQSGISIQHYSENVYYNTYTFPPGITSLPTDINGTISIPGHRNEYTNSYTFIDIPLNIGYTLRTGKKTNLSLETGASYARLTKINALYFKNVSDTLNINSFENATLSDTKPNQIFGNAAISFNWEFTPKLQWRNSMAGKYDFTNLYRADDLQSQHIYGFGFQTAIVFNF